MSATIELEPIVEEGGTLDFNSEGKAGCWRCGWRGVPTILDGQPSTFCPSCEDDTPAIIAELLAASLPRQVTKIGRNDPCPCGSGRKYKKCCG